MPRSGNGYGENNYANRKNIITSTVLATALLYILAGSSYNFIAKTGHPSADIATGKVEVGYVEKAILLAIDKKIRGARTSNHE